MATIKIKQIGSPIRRPEAQRAEAADETAILCVRMRVCVARAGT